MPLLPGFNRSNNVPHWQRLHQQNDGVRQWNKGPRAKFMLYPYYALLATSLTGNLYMLTRMALGHKTWW